MSKENAINAASAARPSAEKETAAAAPVKAKPAAKPAAAAKPAVKKTATKAATKAAVKTATKSTAKPATKAVTKVATKVATKATTKKTTAKKATVKKAAVKKTTAKKATKPIAKKPVQKTVVKAPVKNLKSAVKPVEVKEKIKKSKLVRDSFTMPEIEYQVLSDVKKAFLKAGVSVKKSELLRAGVALIRNLELGKLNTVIKALSPIKAGRPKKEK